MLAPDNGPSPVDFDLPVSIASMVLAAGSSFAFPVLAPLAAAVFLYSVIPSFKGAYRVLFKEKRLGVDVLDGDLGDERVSAERSRRQGKAGGEGSQRRGMPAHACLTRPTGGRTRGAASDCRRMSENSTSVCSGSAGA